MGRNWTDADLAALEMKKGRKPSAWPGPPLDCLESELQSAILKAAKAGGWLAYHTHRSDRSEKGFPDLVLVHPGRQLTMFWELKRETEKPSKEQRDWLKALTDARQIARVVRPSDWPFALLALLGIEQEG